MASLSRKIKRSQLRKKGFGRKNHAGLNTLERSASGARHFGATLGGALVLLSAPAVLAGEGFTTQVDGDTTTFNQSAPKVFNKTDVYNIGVDEVHQYNQPGADSIFVQRVMGGDSSSLLGQLIANGQVWVMNPSGVLIGAEARVNAAGFMATSLVMSEDDFFAGRYDLHQEGDGGYVINDGDITVNNGGYAVLAGASVVNNGYIQANLGEVVLASGRQMTVDFTGDGLINFAVDEKTAATVTGPDGADMTSAVLNAGEVRADGGRVTMTARAASDVFDAVVNNEGVVEAQTAEMKDGLIVLSGGDEGVVSNEGVLNASGATGGDVRMDGEYVGQFGEVRADGVEGDGGSVDIAASEVIDIGAGSVTTANAGVDGDGGLITAISPNMALFRDGATIEAKGGSLSGDGGFVEVSGQSYVEINGSVVASAPNGSPGLFYIDPTDVTITNVTANMTGSPNWVPDGDPDTATIDAAGINASLQGGTAVSVDTTSAGGNNGDINVAADIDNTGVAGGDLSLSADEDITVQFGNSITITNASLTLEAGTDATNNLGTIVGIGDITATQATMTADDAIVLSGNTYIDSLDATVTETGGSITLSKAMSDITLNNVQTSNGDISVTTPSGSGADILAGNVNAGTATVSLSSNGAINDDGDAGVDISGGTVNLTAVDGIGNSGVLEVSNLTSAINTSDANIDIDISATAAVTVNTLQTNTGSINLDQTGGQTLAVTTATTADGPVTITNDSADLTLGTIIAGGDTGGDDDINVSTTTSGNIIAGSLTAANDEIIITSAGTVLDDGDTAADATAATLTIAAAGAAGADAVNLDTDVDDVNTVTATAGNIVLDEADDVTLTGITADSGNIEVTANQAGSVITVPAAGTVSALGNMVTLRSDDVDVSGTVTADTTGAVNYYTANDVTMDVAFDTGGGAYVISDAEIAQTTAGTIVFGESGVQSGAINVETLDTSASGTSVEINSDAGAGSVTLNPTELAADAIKTGAGDMTIRAGSGGVTANDNITTTGGNIDVTGDVTIGVTPPAVWTVSTSGGDVTFNDAVDGAVDVLMDAGAGATNFVGAVGDNAAIGDGTGAAITINSTGPTTFQSTVDTASGILQLAGAGEVTFSGDVTAAAGDTASVFNENVTLDGMTFTSDNTLTFGTGATDQVTLSGGDVTLATTSGSNMTVKSSVDGAQDLTLNVTGATEFQAAVGSGAPIGDGTGASLTINSTGTTEFVGTVETASGIVQADTAGDVTFRENVTVGTGDTANAFNGNVILDGLTFTSGVDTAFGNDAADQLTLSAAAVTIDSSTAGADVDFNSLVDGAQDLTVSAGAGTVSILNTVGGTTPPTLLDVNATNAVVGADITTSGDILFDGVLTTELQSDVAMTSNGGDINLLTSLTDDPAAIDRTLTLSAGTGAITLDDANIQGITFTDGASVSLNGDITVADTFDLTPITNGQTVSVDGAASVTVTAGDFTTTGEQIDGNNDLDITANSGTVTIGAAIGGNTPLASLDISGDVVTLNAAVTANGDINIDEVANDDALTIGQSVTSNNGNITVDGTGVVAINTAMEATNGAVTVTSDTNASSNTDDVQIAANVSGTTVTFQTGDGTTSVADVDVITATQNAIGTTEFGPANSVIVQGDITAQDSVDFRPMADGNDVVITGGPRTITATDGDIYLTGQDLEGDGTPRDVTLTATGASDGIVYLGQVGAGGFIDNLLFGAGTNGVVMSDNITVQSGLDATPVDDGENFTLSGNVAINAGGNVDFTNEGITGGYDLDITTTLGGSGNVILDTVGGSTAVNSLDIIADGTTTMNGQVDSANQVTVDGVGNVTLNTINAGTLVDVASDGSVTTGGVITAGSTVTLSGNDAGGANEASDVIVGHQLIGTNVLLETAGTLSDVIVNADINNTAGDIVINAADNVELNSSFQTSGSDGNDIAVTAGSNIVLSTDVTITANAATSGTIDLNSNVDDTTATPNTNDLSLVATAGSVDLVSIGANTPIDAFNVNSPIVNLDGAGGVDIQASSVNMSLAGGTALNIGEDLTIDASSGAGDINLAGVTIDDTVESLAVTLTAQNTDTITVENIGTSADRLLSFDVTAGGTLNLGGDIYTENNITVADLGAAGASDSVVITGDFVADSASGNITFNDNINAGAAGNTVEMYAPAGTIDVWGIGNTIPVGDVTIDGQIVNLNGVIQGTTDAVIDVDADANLSVENNISTLGAGTITLTADSETNGTGDLLIAQAAGVSITAVDGAVTLEGENVTLGDGAGNNAAITTTGTGDVQITGNYENDAADGDVALNTGSSVDSGGDIGIGGTKDPFNVTLDGTLLADGDINVEALNNIDVNNTVRAGEDGTGVVTMTADTDSNGGDLTVNAQIRGVGAADGVTLASNNGLIIINTDPDNVDGGIVFSAANEVDLNANVTANGNIDGSSMTGDFDLNGGDRVFDSSTGDGDISFNIGSDIYDSVAAPSSFTATAGTGNVTFGTVGQGGGVDNLTVTSSGTTTFPGLVNVGGNVDAVASDDILVQANMTAGGYVELTAGADAGDEVNQSASDITAGSYAEFDGYDITLNNVTASGIGATTPNTGIDINATNDFTGNGTLTTTDGAGQNIVIAAGNNATINGPVDSDVDALITASGGDVNVNALLEADGNIDVEATAGSIIQAAGNDMLAGGDVSLDANTAITLGGTIGDGTPIGGNILVGQQAGVGPGSVDASGLWDATGYVLVDGTSATLAQVDAAGTDGASGIDVNASTGDVTLNGPLTTTAGANGDIVLLADAGDVTDGGTAVSVTSSEDIDIWAMDGSVTFDAASTLTAAQNVTVDGGGATGAETVQLGVVTATAGNVQVGTRDADPNVVGQAAITAPAGYVEIWGNDVTVQNVTAGAFGGTDADSGIDVNATGGFTGDGTLTTTDGTGGNIEVDAAAGATINGPVDSDVDALITASGGDVNVNALLEADGNIDVEATAGSIIQAAGNNMLAGGDVNLDAGTAVTLDGTIGDTVQIGGNILVGQDATVGPGAINASGLWDAGGYVLATGTEVTVAQIDADGVGPGWDGINLTATTGDVTINDNLTTTDNDDQGEIDITAAGQIVGGAVTLSSDDYLFLNAGTNISMDPASTVESDGWVFIDGGTAGGGPGDDTVTLGTVNSTINTNFGEGISIGTNSNNPDVVVNGTMDSVTHVEVFGNDVTLQDAVTANQVGGVNANGIDVGAQNDIFVNGVLTTTDNGLAGDIDLTAANEITTTAAVDSDNSINATAASDDVNIGALLEADLDIDVEATSGSIIQDAGNDMLAGGNVNLDAGTAITLDGTIGSGAPIGGNILVGQQGIGPAAVSATDAWNATGYVYVDGSTVALDDITAAGVDATPEADGIRVIATDTVAVNGALTTTDNDNAGTVSIEAVNAITFDPAGSIDSDDDIDLDVTTGGIDVATTTLAADDNIYIDGGIAGALVNIASLTADEDLDEVGEVVIGGDRSDADVATTGAIQASENVEIYGAQIDIGGDVLSDAGAVASAEDVIITGSGNITQTAGTINANTGSVDIESTGGTVTVIDVDSAGVNQIEAITVSGQAAYPPAAAPPPINPAVSIQIEASGDIVASGVDATGADANVEVMSDSGNVSIGDITAAATTNQTVYLQALAGNIVDNNDADTDANDTDGMDADLDGRDVDADMNVIANTLDARAQDMIGMVHKDDVYLDPGDTDDAGDAYQGDPIETTVSNLTAITTAAGAEISIDNYIATALTVDNVIPSDTEDASMWLRNRGSITVPVGPPIGWTIEGNDNVGLISVNGDVTIPDGGGSTSSDDINLGNGDGTGSTVRLEALSGGVNAGTTIGVTAEDFILGTNQTVNAATNVVRADVIVDGVAGGAYHNLTLTEDDALILADLDANSTSALVANGDMTITVTAGDFTIRDFVQAFDLTDDDVRNGLIDLRANAGDLTVGDGVAATIKSTNDVDADVNGGLGTDPTEQVSIRLTTGDGDAISHAIQILDGDPGATGDVNLTADGGDMLIDALDGATLNAGELRTIVIGEDARIAAYNDALDPHTGDLYIDGGMELSMQLVAYQDRALKFRASAGDIQITTNGSTESGLLVLQPGAGFDVIMDNGSLIQVNEGVGRPGDLIVQDAANVTMNDNSTIQVEGGVDIGEGMLWANYDPAAILPVTGDISLDEVEVDAAIDTGDLHNGDGAGNPTGLYVETDGTFASADGDINLNGLVDANATSYANVVTLTAAGEISDGNDPAPDNQLPNFAEVYNTTLEAVAGIGTLDNPLELDTIRITANNSGSNDIALHNMPTVDPAVFGETRVTIDSIVNGSSGGQIDYQQTNLDLYVGDALTPAVQSTDGFVDITADGKVTVLPGTAAGTERIVAGAGQIDITGNTVELGNFAAATTGIANVEATGGAITSTSGADGSVDITADTLNLTASGGIGTTTNHVEFNAATLVNATSGDDIFLTNETGDFNIGAISADAGAANVTTVSQANYTDAQGDDAADVAAAIWTATADGGSVGTGVAGTDATDIDTAIDTFVGADIAGPIVLDEADDVTIDTAATTAASNGNIHVDAGGNILAGLAAAGGTGDATLTAGGSINPVAANADDGVAEVSGDIVTLTADTNGIGQPCDATNPAVPLEVTAEVQLDAATTDDSAIVISSIGDLPIGTVNAGGGDVYLGAGANNIIDATVGGDDVADILAGQALLSAAMIGQPDGTGNGTIDTQIGALEAHATTGGVYVTDRAGDLALTDWTTCDASADGLAVSSTEGDIVITAEDSINVTLVNADIDGDGTAGDVTLTADGNADGVGAITDEQDDVETGDVNIVADNLSLSAATGIGAVTDFAAETGDALEIDVNNIQLAQVSQDGGEMFIHAIGDLAVGGEIVLGTTPDTTESVTGIITADGNIDASAGTLNLINDDFGLHAGTDATGTLTIPSTGVDNTGGNLRLIGETDVVDTDPAPDDRDLGPIAANDLYFLSGAAGGDATLNTAVDSVEAELTGAGALTINEDDAIALNEVLTADGDVTVNASLATGGDVEVGVVTAGTNGNVTIDNTANDGGSILDDVETDIDGDGAADDMITGGVLTMTATGDIGVVGGNPINTTVDSITASSTVAGGININEFDAVTLTSATTADGPVNVVSGGTMTATLVTAADAGDDADHDVTLTTTAGDILVGDVTGDHMIVATSAGAIEESGDDADSDLTAGIIELNAETGIGAAAPIETAGATISADTTDGNIDLDNVNAEATTATSLTTGTGDILFSQSGGGDLTVETATTDDGDIGIDSDGSNLTAQTVTAGGDGQNVTLTTTASGNVFVGNITAADDLITVNSVEAIEEDGDDPDADLTAGSLDLNAGTGIGAAAPIETAATSISADTTNGNIDLDNVNADPTTATSLTTGAGDILFSQSGGGDLTVETAETGDGDIGVDVDDADLSVQTATAGGDGQNVTLTTTTSGDVFVDNVTAEDDLITVTAVGAVEELGDDAGADLTGGTLDLNAGTGIGAAAPIETAATSISADTTNGNIDLDNVNADPTTATSLTTGAGDILFSQSGGGDLTVETAETADGDIGVDVDDADLAAESVTAGGDGNDVALSTTTSGNVLLGDVTAEGDVIDVAAAGAIDSIEDDETADATADTINLTAAAGGIGTGSIVDVAAAAAVNADSSADDGDILIDGVGNLPAGNINAGAGDVYLDATDDITDAEGVILADMLTADAGGSMTLDTEVNSLDASAGIFVTVTEENGIDLLDVDTANGAIEVTSTGGTVTVTDVQSLTDADANDISITGAVLEIGLVDAGDEGDVSLAATESIAMVDGGDGVTADVLTGEAVTGIDLITDINSADLEVSGTGNVFIQETDDILLADILTEDGNISVMNGEGDITAGSVVAAGDVVLNSMGDIDSLSDDETADISGETVTLTAASGGIGEDSTVDVVALVALNADTTADDSDIVFDGIGDLPIGEINAGQGDVVLTSTGAIDDAADDDATDIAAVAVVMTAEDGIGAKNPLELAALEIDATTASGDIVLSNATSADASVGELTADDGGVAFTQSGGGSVVFDEAVANGGDLSLANTDADIILGEAAATGTADIEAEGSILDDGSNRTQLTAAEANLTAVNGTIGLWDSPVQVGIDGTLFVAAGGVDERGHSVTIDGAWGEFVEADNIPGDIALNGQPQSVFDWLRVPDVFVANDIIELQVFQEAVYIFHKEDVVIRYVGLGVTPLSDESVME